MNNHGVSQAHELDFGPEKQVDLSNGRQRGTLVEPSRWPLCCRDQLTASAT